MTRASQDNCRTTSVATDENQRGGYQPRPSTPRRSKRAGNRLGQAVVLAAAISVLITTVSNGADASLRRPHGVRGRSPAVSVLARTQLAKTQWRTPQHRRWNPPTTTTTTTVPPTTTTTTTTVPPTTTTTTLPSGTTPYPWGTPDGTEPSGMAPPAPDVFSGYSQSYVTDFSGTSLPGGWEKFTGQPGGDPGAQWAASHVTVGSGLLQLNAWRDPAYGNEWVTGGLCQCGLGQTYGSYFVRSRQTGSGPTTVHLLWPVARVWPPEIDFNETDGKTTSTSATVHYASPSSFDQRNVKIDLTQWHTWGVVWTPSSVTYTVDGNAWGSVTKASEVPNQAMTLDLTQQTWCASGWACPTSPQSTQVDWVAEYVQK